MNQVIDFFIQGQSDCRKGEPERHNNPDYKRGYEFEYWAQESRTWRQMQQENNNGRN